MVSNAICANLKLFPLFRRWDADRRGGWVCLCIASYMLVLLSILSFLCFYVLFHIFSFQLPYWPGSEQWERTTQVCNIFQSQKFRRQEIQRLRRSKCDSAGCLVLVFNYTGDRLNFGLATEQARREGRKVGAAGEVFGSLWGSIFVGWNVFSFGIWLQ